jgi:hypothetical protein
MKIKQLAEILNVDVRRIARQKFKKDLDVRNVAIAPLDSGGYHITVTFDTETKARSSLSFDYDCHGHLITVLE